MKYNEQSHQARGFTRSGCGLVHKWLHETAPIASGLAVMVWMALRLPVHATDPSSLETAPGRLAKDVVPQEYDIAIVPDVKALTISGTESVRLEFGKPTDTIQFNSLNEKLSEVTLDRKPVKNVVSDDKAQLTTVTLYKPASAGTHTLRFAYTGTIETKPQGLFTQPFVKPDGGKDVLLSTQFEATDARRMFPCWDEPAFRANYTLTATVPAEWKVVGNMPIAHSTRHGTTITTTFQRSPKMSSYLVEFSAGDLTRITDRVGKTELGIWTVRGQETNGLTGLANAKMILADYNQYFGMPFPLPKLDSIAVPGGYTGAMENWGAITYNDQTLLVTPASTLEDKQQVFAVQAHEMAHQWYGDLVTMWWWDDIWLNESFASWLAAKETDFRHPKWKWWELRDEDKENAMAADGQPNSHAIQQHVADELEATSAFDPQITYDKGQSVLRMIEAYLGPKTFRAGILGYLKAHAYSNATSSDLWNGLSKTSGRDIGKVVSGWIQQPGFPAVSVTASRDASGNRTITLSQKRFLLQGADASNPRWSVPLQIRSGGSAEPQSVLLTRDGQTVRAGHWSEPLSVNAGAIGFYRVIYDEPTFQINAKAFGTLPAGDRIALLDDQWALVQAGVQKLPTYLVLASSMGSDLDERAWSQITGALGKIAYAERGTPGHDAFTGYASTIIKPVADRLGWDAKPDETPGIQKLRRIVLGDLGAWGDTQVIAEARKRFESFRKNRMALQPDDQAIILSIVAHHADEGTLQQLHELAKSAHDETELRRFYTSLTRVRDPKLAEQVVKIALSDEIPAQADSLRLEMIGSLAGWHPLLCWNTFTTNNEMLLKPFSAFAPQIIARVVPQVYWNAVPLDQLEAWVKEHDPAEMAPEIARGMDEARFQVALKQALVLACDSYLQAKSDKSNPTTLE